MANLLSSISSSLGLRSFTTGISISDRMVRLVRFTNSGTSLMFDTYRELPLSPAVFDSNKLAREDELLSAFKAIDRRLVQGVVVVAIPDQTEVGRYRALCSKAGIKPVAIVSLAEAESQAVIETTESDVLLLVSSRAHYLELSIVRSNKILSQSILPVGIEELAATLSRGLGITREEAVKVLYVVGLSSREMDMAVLANLSPTVSAWADGLKQKFFQWENEQKEKGYPERLVERVVLCGDIAWVPGLRSYIQGRTSLPVTAGNPWVNLPAAVEEVPELLYDESLSFSAAIGAARLGR